MQEVNLRVSDRDFSSRLVVVPTETVEETELMFAPRDLLLAVEIVSPSTRARGRSPQEGAYARESYSVYWRIERPTGRVSMSMSSRVTNTSPPRGTTRERPRTCPSRSEVVLRPGPCWSVPSLTRAHAPSHTHRHEARRRW
ncbi:hypothetical protein GCM10017559_71110 [Streptosporangium longisporum]|uniref:Restriction endonuclease domain-containing protein n=1 Tax=Streptosporangium longisporum TaxID=46187 RepID=A0ABP6LA92_9ACTN